MNHSCYEFVLSMIKERISELIRLSIKINIKNFAKWYLHSEWLELISNFYNLIVYLIKRSCKHLTDGSSSCIAHST